MDMNVKGEKPIAVIGFSDQASPLEPLWPATHRALIPIAGKAVIVHLIEQLVNADIRHVRIAGSIQQFAVRNRLGDGSEWGITIRYSDLHGDDLRLECLASTGRCLYLRGDEFHCTGLAAPCEQADRGGLASDIDEGPGLWLLRDGTYRGYSLATISGGEVYSNTLASVMDYHLANIKAAQGHLLQLNLPGSRVHRHAHVDWKSSVERTAFIGSGVVIGKHCKVGKLTRLEKNCVLANGVIVQSGTRLENVTVLPNCYVGRGMSVRDAVLGPDGYFGLDGTYREVGDPRLLAPSRDNHEQRTGIPSLRFAETFYRAGPARRSGRFRLGIGR
ncbi:MAG: hypothetical protein KJO46_02950 [Gammaproteobacteria bacterium]|nr:hypothetical protein [Gammaproteobacteria bacterium]